MREHSKFSLSASISSSKYRGCPKTLLPEGDSPSRPLPHVAISNGKPFHRPYLGYGSESRNFGCKCSDQGVPEVQRFFWDDLDNLNTHTPGSFYETYSPEKAKVLWDRFELVYTPKHGSWLNMAEIELSVLTRQCLSRRIDTIEEVRAEVKAWENARNNKNAKVNWQFTTEDARIKLIRLYPTLED